MIKRKSSASPVCYADEVDPAYMWAEKPKATKAKKKTRPKAERKKRGLKK